MLEFLRALRRQGEWPYHLPGLVLAFLIAELFFKFKSFALECGAFLVTWALIDWLIQLVARRQRAPRSDAPS